MNRFEFMGRLSHEPEERATKNGEIIIRFSFAVGRTYKAEGQPDADFFHIVMFGKTAERFSKLNIRKGTKLLITGEIRNDNYTDKDGVKHYRDQFIGNTFEFCEPKSAEKQVTTESTTNVSDQPQNAENDAFMTFEDVNDDLVPWL